MAYEQKPNTGSLFKNERKESDTHADYRGSALINGVDHWLDAWINTSSSGAKYMSLKFKPKDAGGGTVGAARQTPFAGKPIDDLEDDVPFVSCDPRLERRVR